LTTTAAAKALEVLEHDDVGVVAGAIAPRPAQAVGERGMGGGQEQDVLGGIPAATAMRHIASMWPSRTSVVGSRSSVQNAQRSGPCSRTSGRRSRRLRALEASRRSTHMPRRRLASASSYVVDSWSVPMPAAT
jgi:hypothetical protein